jgi:hypothetical protein
MCCAVLVACGSGAVSLTEMATGTWNCSVRSRSKFALSFEAATRISSDRTYAIDVNAGGQTLKITGTWKLAGDTLTATSDIRGEHEAPHRFTGVAKDTKAVAIFSEGDREGRFSVKRDGNDHITFTQTESYGTKSRTGGEGDAYTADCRKR